MVPLAVIFRLRLPPTFQPSCTPAMKTALGTARRLGRSTGYIHGIFTAGSYGVGGVFSAEDAYVKIRAGASLVQLYTALIYEGPFLPRRIVRGLSRCLERDGLDDLRSAVGKDA